MNKRTYWILSAVFAVLTLVCLTVIFRLGSQNSTDSSALSDKIVEKIRESEKSAKNIDIADTPEKHYSVSVKVRKSAHITEYFSLGFCSALFAACFYGASQKKLLFLPSTLCFAVAISDEFIQSKVGRTDSVRDIVIDACSSAAGIVIVAVMIGMVVLCAKAKKAKRRRKKNS